jgi:hypothetical protein
MKKVKTNNPVAKYDFNRGGFHTPSKFTRKIKHKGKRYE